MTAKKPKVTAVVNPLNKGKTEPVLEKPINHIALLVDESGSMQHLTRKVIDVVNEQLGTIKVASKDSGQDTAVSVYTFEDNKVKVHFRNAFPESVNFYNYQPRGNTPLNDAINQVISDMEADTKGKADESYLVIVITDGEENASRGPKPGPRIKAAQKTDKWSFAFMVPPGASGATVAATGVHPGNIREWEATEQGLREAFAATRKGTIGYFNARSAGVTSTACFYTELAGVKTEDLKQNLQDVKNAFHRWKVDKETDIQSFVQEHGIGYQPGKGYYQLTKSETIQDHKDLVIGEKKSRALFGGPEAKELVGISSGPGVSVKVKPGNHGNFEIFVKSTSTNRKLVRGTDFLYQK